VTVGSKYRINIEVPHSDGTAQRFHAHETDSMEEVEAYALAPPHSKTTEHMFKADRYITAVTDATWVDRRELPDGSIQISQADRVVAFARITAQPRGKTSAKTIACLERGIFMDGGKTDGNGADLGLPKVPMETVKYLVHDWKWAWLGVNSEVNLLPLIAASKLPQAHAMLARCACARTGMQHVSELDLRAQLEDGISDIERWAYGQCTDSDVDYVRQKINSISFGSSSSLRWVVSAIDDATFDLFSQYRGSYRNYEGDIVKKWNSCDAMNSIVNAAIKRAIDEAAVAIREIVKLPDICYSAARPNMYRRAR